MVNGIVMMLNICYNIFEVIFMNLKVAICDDENIICNEIKLELKKLKPNHEIDIYTSGQALLNSNKIYDLIFLDIEMPEINGMQIAGFLRKKHNGEFIIFLTSHIEFMPNAFKVKAFRFLNKPIDIEKFEEAVLEAEKEILNNEKVTVTIQGRTFLVNQKDILYFEAFGDGTYIHTKKTVIESNKPLKCWVQKMGDEHFYQVHKSYFVALRYVKSINASEIELHYLNQLIPISRRKLSPFKKAFFDYIRKNARYM